MKKVLAIVLSVMMIFACLPLAASATVAKDDTAIDYLINGEYYHLTYLEEKENFKTELATLKYTGAYDNAWDNLFTGSVAADEAETILLALIEKIDAEYQNETFEKVIKVLETANTVAGVVEKVDSYTNIIGLAENSTWAQSIGALGTIIKAANYTNQMYETFVEGYAAILSAQAAATYYGDYLDYLANNCSNKAVKTAAAKIKANITKTYEESIEALLAEITEQAAKDGAQMGVEIAMDSWYVTAAIKTAYNTVTNISKKVFNTTDKYKYMSSLVILKDIEAVTPDYVSGVLAADDADANDFAINVILTIRETGEDMVNSLVKVTEESYVDVEYLFKGVDRTEVKESAAKGVVTLGVIRNLINAEAAYTTYAPTAVISTTKNVVVYNAAGEVVASLAANSVTDKIDETGAYVTVYNAMIDGTVTVVVPFQAGAKVEVEAAQTADTGSTTNSGEKLSFFQRLIQSIKEAFAKLFGGLFKK